jgi:hypothetical protein
MLTEVLLALLACLVVGAGLLALGVRGRRVDDHPTCRGCRFDLSALAPGMLTCPECGTGLRRPGAIRIGQRRRLPMVIATGAFLALVPAMGLGLGGMAALKGGMDRQKPLGMLLWESGRGGTKRRTAVATEVLRRYAAGSLSPGQVDKSLETALALQGDLSVPWLQEWGSLVDQARANGKLSDERELRFNRQAMIFTAKVRPRIRVGDPLPVSIRLSDSRIGPGDAIFGYLLFDHGEIDGQPTAIKNDERGADGKPWREGLDMGTVEATGSATRWAGGPLAGCGSTILRIPEGIAPGAHALKLRAYVELRTFGPSKTISWSLKPIPEDPHFRSLEFDLPFDVVGEGDSLVTLMTPDPAMDAELTAYVASVKPGLNAQSPAYTTGHMIFDIQSLKVPLAYDVFWKPDGSEERLLCRLCTGDLASARGAQEGRPRQYRTAWLDLPRGYTGGVADLTLRPSLEMAQQTTDLYRIYGGTLTIPGVKFEITPRPAPKVAAPATNTGSR